MIPHDAPFTARNDPHVEQQLRAELSRMAALVDAALGPRLQALLLTGGFGRGEGSVMKTEQGIRVVNDYDFVLVVKPRDAAFAAGAMHELVAALEAGTTAKQVDTVVVPDRKLLVPAPTVARYEIRHGHRVLLGRLPYPITALSPRLLPLEEGTKYLRTRAGGLLIARLLLDGYGDFDLADRLLYAQVEIDKAWMAIGDTALIAAGRYHYLYRERRRRVMAGEAPGIEPQDRQAYAAAVERKLRPGSEMASAGALEQAWQAVLPRYLAGILSFEGRRLGQAFDDGKEYAACCGGPVSRWHRLRRSRWWSLEDRPRLLQTRLRVFSLLAEYEAARRDEAQYASWQQQAAETLAAWHPGGIVGRLHEPVHESMK